MNRDLMELNQKYLNIYKQALDYVEVALTNLEESANVLEDIQIKNMQRTIVEVIQLRSRLQDNVIFHQDILMENK